MIYDNVKSLAKKRKMTISQVEKEAHLSKGIISKWKTASPNVDSLKAVAAVLRVKVDKLIE